MSTTEPTLDLVGRVFDALEVVRDAVQSLSREHDSIRDDLREIRQLLASQATTATD